MKSVSRSSGSTFLFYCQLISRTVEGQIRQVLPAAAGASLRNTCPKAALLIAVAFKLFHF